MPLLETIGTGLSIFGGLKSLFEEDQDPGKERRDKQREVFELLKGLSTGSRGSGLQSDAFVQSANLMRRITDASAAAGGPRSLGVQNLALAGSEGNRNLLNALAWFRNQRDQQNLQRFSLMSRLAGDFEPEQLDTSAEDLFSTGIQLLTSGAEGGGDEEFNIPGLDELTGERGGGLSLGNDDPFSFDPFSLDINNLTGGKSSTGSNKLLNGRFTSSNVFSSGLSKGKNSFNVS